MTAVFIGVMAYVAVQLVIGMLVSRRIRTESDYLLAGRSFGYLLATFSIFATWFGAETCIGAAGAIYEDGLSGANADPFGYAICLLLMGLFFAVPLWNRGITTLADLFRRRYSVTVERTAALMMIPTSILWAAAQIRAFGQVLAAASELQVVTAISIATAVVILYTASGGLRADAITDVIQGAALSVGLVVVLVTVVYQAGGPVASLQLIDPERLNPFAAGNRSILEVADAWAIPVFGSMAAQELVSRVIASRSPVIARRSSLMATAIYLSIGLIPAFLGLIGGSLVTGLNSPEHLLTHLAETYLPTVLYIIFAGALISAILSTVDSALLSASALLSHNVIISFRPHTTDALKLKYARAGVVVLGLVAYLLAIYGGSVYELVETASAFGSAGVVVVFLFGLLTKFGNSRSAISALVTGMLVWVYASFIAGSPIAYLLALCSSFAAYVVVAVIPSRRVYDGTPRSVSQKH